MALTKPPLVPAVSEDKVRDLRAAQIEGERKRWSELPKKPFVVTAKGLLIPTPDGTGDVLNGAHRRAAIGETILCNEFEARSHVNKILPPHLWAAKQAAEKMERAIAQQEEDARPLSPSSAAAVEAWPTLPTEAAPADK
jgi:hypothetical protein